MMHRSLGMKSRVYARQTARDIPPLPSHIQSSIPPVKSNNDSIYARDKVAPSKVFISLHSAFHRRQLARCLPPSRPCFPPFRQP